jgi:hypothetical protein
MEFQGGKLFWMFLGIMAVGFLIVATTRETPQDKMQTAFLQSSNLLSKMALEKCSEAVHEAAKTRPYTPSDSSSDHQNWVHLTWKNVGQVKQAECKYIMNQGITFLKLDDRTLISQTP